MQICIAEFTHNHAIVIASRHPFLPTPTPPSPPKKVDGNEDWIVLTVINMTNACYHPEIDTLEAEKKTPRMVFEEASYLIIACYFWPSAKEGGNIMNGFLLGVDILIYIDGAG